VAEFVIDIDGVYGKINPPASHNGLSKGLESKKLPLGILRRTRQSVLESVPPNEGEALIILPIDSPPIGKFILRILLSKLDGLDKLLSAPPNLAAVLSPALITPNPAWAVLAAVESPFVTSNDIFVSSGKYLVDFLMCVVYTSTTTGLTK
jgi:hypothetical protein